MREWEHSTGYRVDGFRVTEESVWTRWPPTGAWESLLSQGGLPCSHCCPSPGPAALVSHLLTLWLRGERECVCTVYLTVSVSPSHWSRFNSLLFSCSHLVWFWKWKLLECVSKGVQLSQDRVVGDWRRLFSGWIALFLFWGLFLPWF